MVAEVKLPLRKPNVWTSVKVDMETHLRLPLVSREEIKPEMDVPGARGEWLGGVAGRPARCEGETARGRRQGKSRDRHQRPERARLLRVCRFPRDIPAVPELSTSGLLCRRYWKADVFIRSPFAQQFNKEQPLAGAASLPSAAAAARRPCWGRAHGAPPSGRPAPPRSRPPPGRRAAAAERGAAEGPRALPPPAHRPPPPPRLGLANPRAAWPTATSWADPPRSLRTWAREISSD